MHSIDGIPMEDDNDMRPLCDMAAKHIKDVAKILDDATGGEYGKYDEAILNEARTIAWEIDHFYRAIVRAERKLSAYVGVCSGDKELTETILPMLRRCLNDESQAVLMQSRA